MIFYLQMFIPNPLPLYCLPLQCTVYIMYEAAHPFSMQHCQPFHFPCCLCHVVFTLCPFSEVKPCCHVFFYTLTFLWGQTLLPFGFYIDTLVFPLRPNPAAIWFSYWSFLWVQTLLSFGFYTLSFLWGQLFFTLCTSSEASWFLHFVLPLKSTGFYTLSFLCSEPKPCCHFVFPLCPSSDSVWGQTLLSFCFYTLSFRSCHMIFTLLSLEISYLFWQK